MASLNGKKEKPAAGNFINHQRRMSSGLLNWNWTRRGQDFRQVRGYRSIWMAGRSKERKVRMRYSTNVGAYSTRKIGLKNACRRIIYERQNSVWTCLKSSTNPTDGWTWSWRRLNHSHFLTDRKAQLVIDGCDNNEREIGTYAILKVPSPAIEQAATCDNNKKGNE